MSDTTEFHHETPERLLIRRSLSYRYRVEQRATYAKIAATLRAGVTSPATGEVMVFDVSPRSVRDDYFYMLRENGYVSDPAEVEEQRAAELRKLDEIEDAYWDAAVGIVQVDGKKTLPDPQAANIVMRAMRQRAQLSGLNQVKLTGADGGPVQIELSIPDNLLMEMLAESMERSRSTEASEPSMN